jgi:hypothetical protein
MRRPFGISLGVSLILGPLTLAPAMLVDCSSPDPSVNFPPATTAAADSGNTQGAGTSGNAPDTGTVASPGSADATVADTGLPESGSSSDASEDGG